MVWLSTLGSRARPPLCHSLQLEVHRRALSSDLGIFQNRNITAMVQSDARFTEQHLELLKSFRYLTNEQQIADVTELLRLYFEQQLDMAISAEEGGRDYSAEIYETWLRGCKESQSS